MNFKAPPIRFWIGVMVFFTTFTNYMLRSNISVSLLSMTGKTNKTRFDPPCLSEDELADRKRKNQTLEDHGKRYDWDENEQSLILAAYFYGYVISSGPAGILSEMWGAWDVIFYSSVAGAVLTALTPLCADIGFPGIFVNRLIVGILGGLGYPAINVLIARWAPPKEKGKFLAAMMGNTLGVVITWNILGIITPNLGWAWGFYVVAIIMGVFCFAFFFIASNGPHKHRWITPEEQQYITEAQAGKVSMKKAVPPYKKIMLSGRFWAVIAGQFANLWALLLVITYAPKFMKETLGYDIKKAAGLAALPYLGRLISSFFFGAIGDYLRREEIMSPTKIRKLFIIFSHLVPAASFFLVRAVGCNAIALVIFIVLNQTFNGAVVVSHLQGPQDLSPNFAGTLYGIMNVIGSTSGFIAPSISGALTEYYKGELIAAVFIFMIGGIILGAGGIIYFIFGTAEVQEWNEKKEEEA